MEQQKCPNCQSTDLDFYAQANGDFRSDLVITYD
jgi:hypothetical protein